MTLLKDAAGAKTLVFSRTKHGANRIVRVLDKAGLQAAAIHGNKSLNARVRALERFRQNAGGVLVATDIAARGIDVDGITHVINFELPNVPETYVHRIGRTARAGATGVALSFCDVEERDFLVDIERLLGEHIERVQEHDFIATQPPPPLTELSPGRRQQAGGKRNPKKRRRRRGRSSRASRDGAHR